MLNLALALLLQVSPMSGLVKDKLPRNSSPIPKPAFGQCIAEPDFGVPGTRICRLSNASAVTSVPSDRRAAMPMYSTIQAWNADESLLIGEFLGGPNKGHFLMLGRAPYTFLGYLPLTSPTDIEQIWWDPVDPRTFYYPSNYNGIPRLYRYNFDSQPHNQVWRDFSDVCTSPGPSLGNGPDPMWSSYAQDGKMLVGLKCFPHWFIFDVKARTMSALQPLPEPDSATPTMSPSGRFLQWGGLIYDFLLNRSFRMALANPYDHADWVQGVDGKDSWATAVYDFLPGEHDYDSAGTLVVVDLETNTKRVVIGQATGYPYPPTGTHISGVAQKRPGFVAVSTVGTSPTSVVQPLIHNEIMLVELATGLVARIAHHRSCAGECGHWGYWGEPHPVLSPTGNRILFASDWYGSDSVEIFVLELPAYTQSAQRIKQGS